MNSSANDTTRWLLLGASRGLGWALVEELRRRQPRANVLGIARRWSEAAAAQIQTMSLDMSRGEDRSRLWPKLAEFLPERIVCALGGGPYGDFGKVKWPSHEWALQVSLMAPLEVVHACLRLDQPPRQIVLVGSAVAESDPDPGAASYSAAKHGLLGFTKSLRAEHPRTDLRVFSPGYMDTLLLPQGAPPRRKEIWSPSEVAGRLLDWADDPAGAWHHRLAVHPGQD